MNRQEFLEAYATGERDFRNLNLEDWDLKQQTLSKIDLSYAKLNRVNFARVNLYEAKLQVATFISARLFGANLRTTNLTGAQLHNVNLRAADLRRSDLTEANFTHADLRGADLRQTIGFLSAIWQDAVYDEFTEFPDDIDPSTLGMIQIRQSISTETEIQKELDQAQSQLSQLQSELNICSAKLLEEQQQCEILTQQLANAQLTLQNQHQSSQTNSQILKSNFIEKIHAAHKIIPLEMIYIPNGCIRISSDMETVTDSDNQIPAFYIGKYPITQAQYQGVIGKNPSHFRGENLPVDQISWDEAVIFCQQLSKKTGKSYRLPMEAEWEYACRAGATSQYSFGDDEKKLGDYAWYSKNSGSKTHPVGQKKPNNWGLYDMHGNVWEWCQDPQSNHSQSPGTLIGSSLRENHSCPLRGGSWNYDFRYCTCTRQIRLSCQHQTNYLGFRVVCASA